MECELLACCKLFKDSMENLPKTAEYIKEKLCFGDHESCNRYRIYKEFGGADIPSELDPYDSEEVRKIVACRDGKRQ